MATQSTTTIRRVRRTSGSSTDIFPLAVLPIIGLPIVFLLGLIPFAQHVQAVNLRTTTYALEQADLAWVKVEADGQWIRLSGTPPTSSEGERAIAISKAAVAPHLFGADPPATRVEGEFAKGVTSVVPQPAPRLDNSPYAWAWRLTEGVLTLTGEVPDQVTHDVVVEQAEATKAASTHVTGVVDELEVRGNPAPDGFAAMGRRGIDTLGHCERGVASWGDRILSVSCELARADEAAARAKAEAEPQFGALGEIELLASEDIASCEAALKGLLSSAKIQFSTGSSVISSKSNALLDKISAAAATCPGTLSVDGHTDSDGKDQANLDLSQRRAEATRQALIKRNIAADRLVAKGYGETRPIADNGKASGKASNRRIELRVVRSTD